MEIFRISWLDGDMNDTRSDEVLVEAYWQGEREALEILLTRYLTPIMGHLLSISFFKNEPYLDDIRQKILLTVSNELRRKGGFVPRGEGSFKKWIYRIAYFKCINSDKKRRKDSKTISEVFPQEPTGFPDDLILQVKPQSSDYERARLKLQEVTKFLTPEELKLMRLVSERKPYKEIIKEPEFSKFSLDYLKRKVYYIRKKAKSLRQSDEGGEI